MRKGLKVELWSNEQETKFGIRLAGEKGFRATTGPGQAALSKFVESSPYFDDSSYSWPYALSRWVYSRYRKKVRARPARVALFAY